MSVSLFRRELNPAREARGPREVKVGHNRDLEMHSLGGASSSITDIHARALQKYTHVISRSLRKRINVG